MNYLGIDYGEKQVGVAVAAGPLAQPLVSVPRARATQTIKQLVGEYKVKEIVVGVSDASMHRTVEEFVKQFGLPVHLVDETLSTHDATQSLLHTTRSRRKNLEHAAAAALILQNWLDFQKGNR